MKHKIKITNGEIKYKVSGHNADRLVFRALLIAPFGRPMLHHVSKMKGLTGRKYGQTFKSFKVKYRTLTSWRAVHSIF